MPTARSSQRSLSTSSEEVRRTLNPWQVILSPGIGFQGGEADKAVKAGTDIAIVGRTIIDAESPQGDAP
jgi:orotidine-5'-phosphate decarboxylase